MNKTFFNLEGKISIIIAAVLGVIFSFMTNAFYVGDFWSFILYIFRFCLFISIYLIFYFVEKNNTLFKNKSKIMGGYLLANALVNVCCALFSVTHILKEIFLLISGVVCFWTIIAFILDIIILFTRNKWVTKINNLNEKIGSMLINPIVNCFDNKTTSD